MKQFVKTIILFVFPLLCGLGLLEWGMRSVPNNYSYKKQLLDQKISTIKIWNFGSSHAHNGINPNYFSKNAFNSAHVSQSLKYDAFIFEKYIDRADSLEWIILPISYFSLVSGLEDSEEWWRLKNYVIYYDCPYFPYVIKYHFEVAGSPYSYFKQVKRVWSYLLYQSNDINSDSTGFCIANIKSKRDKDWLANGSERVSMHTKDLSKGHDIIRENIGYIESIIQVCKNRQVKVLLLTLPTSKTYYSRVDSVQYELMLNTCELIEHENNNVYYLNLFKDERFVEDDFMDSDHLEISGAAKCTRIIDEYIRKKE